MVTTCTARSAFMMGEPCKRDVDKRASSADCQAARQFYGDIEGRGQCMNRHHIRIKAARRDNVQLTDDHSDAPRAIWVIGTLMLCMKRFEA